MVSDLENEPIVVSCECDEPEGTIVRNVRFMTLSREHLQEVWLRARGYKHLFNTALKNDFKIFCELFLRQGAHGIESRGLFWVIDNFVGVYYITDVTEIDASVHYTFFDGRHRGRVNLTKKMLEYGFETYGFRRFSTAIPKYMSKDKFSVFKFVEAVGFQYEGKTRGAAFYEGTWFDLVRYGLLRDELKWDTPKKTLVADQQQDSQMTSLDSLVKD